MIKRINADRRFNYLLVSPGELDLFLDGTGWRMVDGGSDGSRYLAVMAKR
jgi:hypothetical protein